MDLAEPQKGLVSTPCDVKALEACLKENHGDRKKCQQKIAAFQSACSASKDFSLKNN